VAKPGIRSVMRRSFGLVRGGIRGGEDAPRYRTDNIRHYPLKLLDFFT
jgi:hypothetical protein